MKQMSASERAAASGSGIIRVTQGPADLVAPRPRPNESAMRYGLGFPFAVGPKQAALFCNLRNEGHPVGDFENGTDVVLFDDLDRISADHAVAVCRNDTYTNPQTGEPRIVMGLQHCLTRTLGRQRDDKAHECISSTSEVHTEQCASGDSTPRRRDRFREDAQEL